MEHQNNCHKKYFYKETFFVPNAHDLGTCLLIIDLNTEIYVLVICSDVTTSNNPLDLGII